MPSGTTKAFIIFGCRNGLDERVGGGGVSNFSVEKFLSHSAEKFRRANFQGATNFAYRKALRFRGLYHDFTAKNFCLRVPKHFVEEPFSAVIQRISGSEKVYGKKGGLTIESSFDKFLSRSAEKFRG